MGESLDETIDPPDSSEGAHTDTVDAARPAHVRPLPPDVKAPFTKDFLSRYELQGFLGRGGMGTVFLMRQAALGRSVAVKVVRADELTPADRRQFQKEARVLASLSHHAILNIHDVGEDDGVPFMVCEFVGGDSLATRMVHGTPLTLVQSLKLIAQILDGLKAAHKAGVVHRDIKPANVLLTEAGRAKVADFGLARWQDAPSGTQAGRIMGTPPYMSPEQCRGEPADAASDLYAVGVMLFELTTGRRPFLGPDKLDYLVQHTREQPPQASSVKAGLPPALDALIASALSKKPENRPASASAFRKSVLQILHEVTPARGQRGAGASSGENAAVVPETTPTPRPAPAPSDSTFFEKFVGVVGAVLVIGGARIIPKMVTKYYAPDPTPIAMPSGFPYNGTRLGVIPGGDPVIPLVTRLPVLPDPAVLWPRPSPAASRFSLPKGNNQVVLDYLRKMAADKEAGKTSLLRSPTTTGLAPLWRPTKLGQAADEATSQLFLIRKPPMPAPPFSRNVGLGKITEWRSRVLTRSTTTPPDPSQ